MRFKRVTSHVDFPQLERKILRYWEEKGILRRYLKKNARAKKRFRFLDGPVTANNPMGVHHAWGRSYKDLFQRYKNMQGFRQRFQNGFDCQGLWIEVEVEKELGFKSKRDIEKFGLDKFSEACNRRVQKYSKVQADQSLRLGYWMDWENSYYTFSEKNIEYIWHFLKECHKRGWLYKGFRSLPWCARCGTSLSQHELFDSYVDMTHKSVFLKFPVVHGERGRTMTGKDKEYFLVWTTTPWTLAANVALAIHPDLSYARVKQGSDVLILAEALLSALEGEYKVLEKMSGSQLKGLRYESPFNELPVQKDTQKVVLLWKDISSEEGTGIVHIAPGCGDEDFELGRKHNLKVLVPLDENGNYVEGYGFLTGNFAHSAADAIFAFLKERGLLYKVEDYTHRYPVCWRCKEPIVFRAEENWFISTNEVRPRMIREARKVKWHPEHVGKLMEDWLKNMGDWNISRKRYFGLPLPFYECDCGEAVVVGSKRELKKLAVDPKKVDNLSELHRPWIDEVTIECPQCGKEVKRVADVGDCWLDAGIVPFSTLKYLEDKDYWKQWFPADWICEMREQVRLWFYSTLFMAATLEDKTPYKEVLSYEKLYDEKGKPMHKSAGNAIWFDDAAEKMGADIMRWMYFTHDPATNINFGYGVADEIRRRFFLILWNCYKFFIDNAIADGWSPPKKEIPPKHILDKWIYSRLNGGLKNIEENGLENYDPQEAATLIWIFVNDLSRWYIRRSRDRFGPSASIGADKNAAYYVLWDVLVTLSKILAPFAPFIAEEIHRNLTGEPSVHLESWPRVREEWRNGKLEKDMELVQKIAEAGHSFRKTSGIPLRQPLAKVEVIGFPGFRSQFSKELTALIAEELNVKEVTLKKGGGDLSLTFDTKLTPELKAEGRARELVREIQDLRKEKGLQLSDFITVTYPPSSAASVNQAGDFIKRQTLAKELKPGKKLLVRRATVGAWRDRDQS